MTLKNVLDMPEIELKIEQAGGRKKLFTITYGHQVQKDLPYSRAAEEFGRCMFHALACRSHLDNNGE